MGIFDDTTTSPCVEIVEETYQEMGDVLITTTKETSVDYRYIDRSQVKSIAVYDYIQYLIMWSEMNYFRKRQTIRQKCQEYFSSFG